MVSTGESPAVQYPDLSYLPPHLARTNTQTRHFSGQEDGQEESSHYANNYYGEWCVK